MMIRTILVATILAALLMVGCGEQADEGVGDAGKIKAVATVGMITDIVERVGGDRVSVSGLMGPGTDPHQYKASEGDVSRMAGADVIFYGGLHLEGAMADVLEKLTRRVKTVAVTEGLSESQLIGNPKFKGSHDPHVWFDVSLWQNAVATVEATLIEIDPAGKSGYEARAADLQKELDELDAYIRTQVARVPEEQRILITAHDAFNYFGRAYGFEVRGLQGISTVTEAGTGDVQALAKFIADNKIKAIFVESSVPPRNIEAVQAAVKSRGFEVTIGGELYSDAMGSAGTPDGTYPGMVRHNINTIVSALLGEQEAEAQH